MLRRAARGRRCGAGLGDGLDRHARGSAAAYTGHGEASAADLGVLAPGVGSARSVTGLFWFGMHEPDLGVVGQAVELGITLTIGTAFLVLMLTLPLSTMPRRVKRDYPVGATLTAWATEAGLGVRTLSRLTFYPWSRLTPVDVDPVFVRCRQKGRSGLSVPAYLPGGPDEQAQSVDFPVQLIGPEIGRELAKGAKREPAEIPMAGLPVVIDRALRWRIVRAWLRAQFGVTAWLCPAVFSLNIALQLAIGSYREAIFFVALAALCALSGGLSATAAARGCIRSAPPSPARWASGSRSKGRGEASPRPTAGSSSTG